MDNDVARQETGLIRDVAERTWSAKRRVHSGQFLHESEEPYRTLFNSIDEGFCIAEMIFDHHGKPVDYRFLEANPAFERHTRLENAIGKTMRALVPDHEEHWFETFGEVVTTGEPVRFVNQAKALDGGWYDVYAFRLGGPESRRVAILFSDITERVAAEQALQKSEERLRELNASLERRVAERAAELERQNLRLRRLAKELTRAEQTERKRLSNMLHDGLQQALVAIKMQLDAVDVPREMLEHVSQLVDVAIDASRSLAYELSPPRLHEMPLPETLEWLAEWFEANHRHEVELTTADNFPVLPEDAKIFLYSVVRELLLNSVKHSGASQSAVRLAGCRKPFVRVEVQDSGVGFDPASLDVGCETGGLGLFSVRDGLAAYGGQLQIHTAPGEGAHFIVEMPVARR